MLRSIPQSIIYKDFTKHVEGTIPFPPPVHLLSKLAVLQGAAMQKTTVRQQRKHISAGTGSQEKSGMWHMRPMLEYGDKQDNGCT